MVCQGVYKCLLCDRIERVVDCNYVSIEDVPIYMYHYCNESSYVNTDDIRIKGKMTLIGISEVDDEVDC